MKEIGVYKDGQLYDTPFFLPKNLKPISQSSWCTKHLHEISWNRSYVKYTELVKGYEKCKILSDFLETKIINLDDYACPKFQ